MSALHIFFNHTRSSATTSQRCAKRRTPVWAIVSELLSACRSLEGRRVPATAADSPPINILRGPPRPCKNTISAGIPLHGLIPRPTRSAATEQLQLRCYGVVSGRYVVQRGNAVRESQLYSRGSVRRCRWFRSDRLSFLLAAPVEEVHQGG